MLYWGDNLRSFGSSEEQHIIKSCYDTECDNIDIQPWRIGPYSVTTTMIAARPRWKVDYQSLPAAMGYHNINLNYVCINNTKACNKKAQSRFSKRCFDGWREIQCPHIKGWADDIAVKNLRSGKTVHLPPELGKRMVEAQKSQNQLDACICKEGIYTGLNCPWCIWIKIYLINSTIKRP